MKTCNTCKLKKDLSSFNKNRNSKDGLSHYCRECEKEKKKIYREKNRERLNKESRENYKKNKEIIKKRNNNYREKNREKVLAQMREYYKENSEKIKEYSRNYYHSKTRNILDPSYSYEERMREFSRTLEVAGGYEKTPYSNRIILTHQPHFFEVEKEMWKDPKVREFIFNNRKKYLGKERDELTDREILRAFKISGLHYGFSHFSPFWIKKFIEDFDVKSIYDPCGGWGHRLLGSWGIDYYYNDIDTRTYNGVVSMYEELKEFGGGNKLFFNEDASEFSPPVSYEAVFTCPPYFKVESYTWKETSTKKYSNYSDWLNVWWRSLINRTNPSKYFAFVISETLKSDMTKIVEEGGFVLIEEFLLGKSKSHYGRSSDEFLVVLEKI